MVCSATGAGRFRRGVARSISSALFFALFLFATSEGFADQPTPLTVEHPSKQTIVLTQGFSTTIHSERPFGKISITNPDIVDLVLRTDKSAVLIPGRVGQTNVDFLDDHGTVIGSMDIVVIRQSPRTESWFMITPPWGLVLRIIADHRMEHFEEIPTKEQAWRPYARGQWPARYAYG